MNRDLREATGRYLAFDGKLWKTLVPLPFHPGFLTRAYLAGKRKRFIGPARLFLVSSLVLFAVLRFEAHSVQVVRLGDVIKSDAAESGKRTKPDAKAEAKDSEPDFVDIDNDLRVSVSGLPKSVDGALKDRIEHFNKLPREQKIEQIIAGTTRYGPYAMFVLLPAFAALLKPAFGSPRSCCADSRLLKS